ncbi:MAG: 50S ribosomal protein L9 [Gammaproteobacteria bacterium]|nr:50S ribosomal protein L9 [Gammaproteobacteria bacterium]
MNIILLEKVGKLGNVGDVANVKAGFARNYLFPSGIAIPATKTNLADFEHRRADLMAAHNEKLGVAQGRADKINGMSITIKVNASDEGRLFGSVGTKDISEALNAEGGDITKSEVQLPHGAIRETGNFDISLDLGFDVETTISLTIEQIAGAAPPIVDTETGEELAAEPESDTETVTEAAPDAEPEADAGTDDEEKSE